MTARFRGRKVHRRRPLGVVLVPTRELAVQVVDTIHPYARAAGIRSQLVAGGMNIDKQADALARGVEIIVATPGRLIDLAERGQLMLDRVETTVVDEADHMADLGFLPDVRDILAAIEMGTQKMLFSATLDDQVEAIVDAFLVDPVTHESTPVAAAVATMDHHVLAIEPSAKRAVTAHLGARQGRTLMFTRTQLGAERVAQELVEVGVRAAALHGNKQQGLRTNVLAGFRQGAFPVLVATEVAARGLHVDDVTMVVHVDPAASSRVGTSTTPRGRRRWTLRPRKRAVIASVKASVLPEPVSARASTSRPARASGRIASWISNARSRPCSASTPRSSSGRGMSSNRCDRGAERLRALGMVILLTKRAHPSSLMGD